VLDERPGERVALFGAVEGDQKQLGSEWFDENHTDESTEL
jgi:hypothetical protein